MCLEAVSVLSILYSAWDFQPRSKYLVDILVDSKMTPLFFSRVSAQRRLIKSTKGHEKVGWWWWFKDSLLDSAPKLCNSLFIQIRLASNLIFRKAS